MDGRGRAMEALRILWEIKRAGLWGTRPSALPATKNLSHVADNGRGELGALHFLRALRQAGEVVSDDLLTDGLVQGLHDHFGGFLPAHVLEHHDTGKDHRARVDLVLIGVFG